MGSNTVQEGIGLQVVRAIAAGLAWFVAGVLAAWSTAALWFDVRAGGWVRDLAVALYAVLLLAILFVVRRRWARPLLWAVCFLGVLVWWLQLKPSNTGDWQADVSRTAWADVHGDQVVIHNVRNCDYRAELDYTCAWETRSYDLAQLRGADLYIVYWGSPWIAHTIMSFQFGPKDHIAFSIETRKKVGQVYSAIEGFFRQYELIYIAADERDVVRLRTNYRQDEDVYLYHLAASPARARARFLEYLTRLNQLHERPEWYNALTRNCTTSFFEQRKVTDGSMPLSDARNWRVLLNGKLDELLYRSGVFAAKLPFQELKERAYINPVARASGNDPDFSIRIREGRPGFDLPVPPPASR